MHRRGREPSYIDLRKPGESANERGIQHRK